MNLTFIWILSKQHPTRLGTIDLNILSMKLCSCDFDSLTNWEFHGWEKSKRKIPSTYLCFFSCRKSFALFLIYSEWKEMKENNQNRVGWWSKLLPSRRRIDGGVRAHVVSLFALLCWHHQVENTESWFQRFIFLPICFPLVNKCRTHICRKHTMSCNEITFCVSWMQ